jgi:hypothetical protein
MTKKVEDIQKKKENKENENEIKLLQHRVKKLYVKKKVRA